MDANHAAERFAELFPAVFHRFHRRTRHENYLPTRESLAVLRHLAGVGPVSVTEAAAHFDRSQSAMSEIVQRLVGHDLLERHADDRDRRRTLVWLTEKGQRVLEDAERVLSDRLVAHAVEQMDASDRTKLLEGMQALLDTAKAPKGWDDE